MSDELDKPGLLTFPSSTASPRSAVISKVSLCVTGTLTTIHNPDAHQPSANASSGTHRERRHVCCTHATRTRLVKLCIPSIGMTATSLVRPSLNPIS